MIGIEVDIREEELPVLFLILNESGFVIFSENFDEDIDEDIMKEFTNNLQTLIQENEPELVYRKRFHDFTYILRKMEPFILCYTFVGKSFAGLEKLQKISEIMEKPSPLWDIVTESDKTGKKISYIDSLAISKSVKNIILEEK